MGNGDTDKRNKGNQWPNANRTKHQEEEEEEGIGRWRNLLVGFVGATATTFAVMKLRRTVDWVYSQWSRSQSSWKSGNGGSFRSGFQEEAWKKYTRRMQEEYEEEMERVERIKRMQSVFNRERNKNKRTYESWQENGQGAYHQHFQRNDWYWKADTSYRDQKTNFRETPQHRASYALSHHYSVLGLDRLRTKPYSDDEIKIAFRAKAMEFHPDQNQVNKEAAEAKFKEIMMSYDAIKLERKNTK